MFGLQLQQDSCTFVHLHDCILATLGIPKVRIFLYVDISGNTRPSKPVVRSQQNFGRVWEKAQPKAEVAQTCVE